jgi:hypothetical protein
MSEPQIIINWASILTAAIAAFVFGGFWYGPLFGKYWAGLMNLKMDQKPSKEFMRKALGLQMVGQLLTAYVLAHTTQIWRPSVWGLSGDAPGYLYGFMAGFFTWLGFYIPQQFGKVTWEGRPWKLFVLNSAYEFLSLQIFCQILSNWR